MYAVFEDGSRQHRVSEGDQLDVAYRDVAVGSNLEFDRVLLFSGNEGVQVGNPIVPRVQVIAEVLEQKLGDKIFVQKFRRRKNYHRRTGHRQQLTRVRIREIRTSSATA